MDWIDRYSVSIEVTDSTIFTIAIDATAWAMNHFGEPTNNSSFGVWGVDARDGKFIFDFKYKEDYAMFVLAWG